MLRVEGEAGLGLNRDDRRLLWQLTSMKPFFSQSKKQSKQMYKTVRKAAVLKLNNIFYEREVE